MTGVPPQGFRHAVDLLLKNGVRRHRADDEQIARDLLALGDDMRASPEFAAWVIAEFERLVGRPAPPALNGIGRNFSVTSPARDIFLVYVPEDRLPVAAPIAVELAKRRVSVAFSEYEVETDEELIAAIARGLAAARGGVVLTTAEFLRRGLSQPRPDPRLHLLGQSIPPGETAAHLAAWLSQFNTKSRKPEP
jgi:hypothetical protein